MGTVEKTGTITYVDENGGLVNFYPATKASKVEGLDEHIAGTKFDVNVVTGMLEYTTVTNTTFEVNETSCELEYGARTVDEELGHSTFYSESQPEDMRNGDGWFRLT